MVELPSNCCITLSACITPLSSLLPAPCLSSNLCSWKITDDALRTLGRMTSLLRCAGLRGLALVADNPWGGTCFLCSRFIRVQCPCCARSLNVLGCHRLTAGAKAEVAHLLDSAHAF